MGMSLVEVDSRFRVTVPKEVRRILKVVKGQRLYVVPYGDDLLMKPLPTDPADRLQEIVGDFVFDREVRRKAEKWLLKQESKKS